MDDPETHAAVSITVVRVDALTLAEHDEIERPCTRAFEQDFAGLFDLVRGGEDPLHVVARSRGRIVGHACWATRRLYLDDETPLRTAYVDAVATEPALQGRGLGGLVIARLVAEVRQRGYQLGALSTSRVSFYERQGWERWHGPTAVRRTPGEGLQPTPEHTVLILRTPQTPPLDTTHLLVAGPRDGDPW